MEPMIACRAATALPGPSPVASRGTPRKFLSSAAAEDAFILTAEMRRRYAWLLRSLERNARLYGSEVALVEINPSEERDAAVTWRDFSLIENARPDAPYRREMTWRDFDRKANRFANLLLSRGLSRGTRWAFC